MALKNYKTSELYGELMRRGESYRYEWALHVVALSESLHLLDHILETRDGTGFAPRKLASIKTMLGDGFNNGLVQEAERIAKLERT